MSTSTFTKRILGKVGTPLIAIVPIAAVGLLAAMTVGASQPIQSTSGVLAADTSQSPVSNFFSVSSDGANISAQAPADTNTPDSQSATSNSDQATPDTTSTDTSGNVSITITTNQSFSTDGGSGNTSGAANTSSNTSTDSHVSVNSTTNGNGKTTGNSSSFVMQNGKVVQNTHHNF